MSNGDPPPTSAAPYIIICSGRIEAGFSDSKERKLIATSTCAARFSAYMQLTFGEPIKPEIRELAALQHEIMVHGAEWSKRQAEDKCIALFAKMTEIEGEY